MNGAFPFVLKTATVVSIFQKDSKGKGINTSRFGSALQVLPSEIGEYIGGYFSSVFIVADIIVFISSFSLLLKNVFFINCKFFSHE